MRVIYLTASLLAILFWNCQEEEDANLAPRPFHVTVDYASNNSARITWDEVIDPEDDSVTYALYLNNALIESNYEGTTYLFQDLIMDTPYSGEVHAVDANGNTTIVSFDFNTKAVRTYEGNLVFSYQEDVDNFIKDCYSIINGNVTIGINDLSNITSVEKLSCITDIRGNLYIRYNMSLKSLAGLENLTTIGKSLYLVNNGVENYNGLDNLTTVGGDISIAGFGPSEITGFNNLQSIAGELSIDQTPAETINGFNNLTAVSHVTIFNHVEHLTFIGGFEKLSSIPGHLDMYGNYSLTNLDAFANLTTIGDYFRLATTKLVTIEGLGNLVEVADLNISGNQNLTTLSAFGALVHAGTIYLEGNGAIQTVSFPNLTSTNSLNIQFNATLKNVDGLQGITSINDIYIFHNNDLLNLDGLKNIQSLTSRSLIVIGNSSLADFCGLNTIMNNTTFGPYEYQVSENKFNPTVSDYQSGDCKL